MTQQVTKASCGDPQSVVVARRQTLRPDHKSPKSRPRSRARDVLRLNAGESTPKSYRQIASKLKISLRETAHREVMERAARGPRTALPSQWLLRNTRSGKNGARKSCMRGSGSTAGGYRRQAWNSLFNLPARRRQPHSARRLPARRTGHPQRQGAGWRRRAGGSFSFFPFCGHLPVLVKEICTTQAERLKNERESSVAGGVDHLETGHLP